MLWFLLAMDPHWDPISPSWNFTSKNLLKYGNLVKSFWHCSGSSASHPSIPDYLFCVNSVMPLLAATHLSRPLSIQQSLSFPQVSVFLFCWLQSLCGLLPLFRSGCLPSSACTCHLGVLLPRAHISICPAYRSLSQSQFTGGKTKPNWISLKDWVLAKLQKITLWHSVSERRNKSYCVFESVESFFKILFIYF